MMDGECALASARWPVRVGQCALASALGKRLADAALNTAVPTNRGEQMDPKDPAARPIRGHPVLTRLPRPLRRSQAPKVEPKTVNAKTDNASNFSMIIFLF